VTREAGPINRQIEIPTIATCNRKFLGHAGLCKRIEIFWVRRVFLERGRSLPEPMYCMRVTGVGWIESEACRAEYSSY
jgi:hypothetical protein